MDDAMLRNVQLVQLEIDDSIRPTVKAITEFKQKTPQRAVILAAGFGMRMVPINTEMPKGLLEVNGEALIDNLSELIALDASYKKYVEEK